MNTRAFGACEAETLKEQVDIRNNMQMSFFSRKR